MEQIPCTCTCTQLHHSVLFCAHLNPIPSFESFNEAKFILRLRRYNRITSVPKERQNKAVSGSPSCGLHVSTRRHVFPPLIARYYIAGTIMFSSAGCIEVTVAAQDFRLPERGPFRLASVRAADPTTTTTNMAPRQTAWSGSSLVSDRIKPQTKQKSTLKSKGKDQPEEVPKSRAVRSLELAIEKLETLPGSTKDPEGGCFCQGA